MAQNIFSVKNLSTGYKTYRGVITVLNKINIEVAEGEKVGLVGETGCGKTTTMKSILRLLPSNGRIIGGKVLFDHADVYQMNRREMSAYRKRVSSIFQDPSAALNPVFTIGRQLKDVIRFSSINEDNEKTGKKEAVGKAFDLLRSVQMADPKRILNLYPLQLSGGMKQRICISLAITSCSKLLIADEATTSLDVTIACQVFNMLAELIEQRSMAAIYITHSLGIVRERTDRVYVMYAGNIVEVAKTHDLFQKPMHPYTQGLLAAVPKITGGGITRGIPGRVSKYTVEPVNACIFHTRCQHVMDICRQEKPDFYDVSKVQKAACFLYRE